MKTFEDLVDFRNWLNDYCNELICADLIVWRLQNKIAELDAIIDDLRYTYE